jgi:GTP-binding protein
MKITQAEFVVSAVAPEQYPRQLLPEVAFAGRSNVGKSSLINTLVHRKNLVKTSATPGKTQAINFFCINTRFLLVDLPGYGYAKVPPEVQARWRPMIETYLRQRHTLRAVIHIVDLRHAPTAQDQQLRAWLQHRDLPMVVVATKADQVKRAQRTAHLATIRRSLALPATEPVVLFSSQSQEGRLELWHLLDPFLAPIMRTSSRATPDN